MTECMICSHAGIEAEATGTVAGVAVCDACRETYEALLLPGERLEDLTRETIDERLYTKC